MKKNIFLITLLGVLIYSCSTTKNKNRELVPEPKTVATSDTVRIANDSLGYEIVIFEPGFNPWLATQPPRGFWSQQFLENRNWQYVFEYNQRVLQPNRFNRNIYEMQINYEPHVDYGYEVNYLLYNYFLFMEQRLGQRFRMTRTARF